MHEDSDDIRFQRSLSENVVEWEKRKHPRDRLYRGAQLKEAQKWARRNRPNEQEAAFLRASATQRALSLVGIIVVVLLLASSLGVAGWFVFFQPKPTLVTTLQDSGVGLLRWSIDNVPWGRTIRFAQGLSGIIELTGGDLVFAGGKSLTKSLTIMGPGENQLTISNGNNNAKIHVSKGATLTISGLSFKNSETVSDAFLFNEGTLTISSSIISGNKTTSTAVEGLGGGGIDNSGTLTVTNHTIISNNSINGTGVSFGGGIYNSGKLTLVNSIVSHNEATGSGVDGFGVGGGIFNESTGTINVTSSVISDNKTSTASGAAGSLSAGGGIENSEGGTLTVTNSTFSGNLVTGNPLAYGGGIANIGKLTVAESTFSNNSANSYGGGILSFGTKGSFAIIRFSTIYGNKSNAGGGIWVDPTGSSQMTISGSVIAANSAHDGPDISGALISGGYNLIENLAGATGLNATTDKRVTLTELGLSSTLGNNGGPTQTLALLQGSPAIDAVPQQACSITITDISGHNVTITTDQRGDPRPDESENASAIVP